MCTCSMPICLLKRAARRELGSKVWTWAGTAVATALMARLEKEKVDIVLLRLAAQEHW